MKEIPPTIGESSTEAGLGVGESVTVTGMTPPIEVEAVGG